MRRPSLSKPRTQTSPLNTSKPGTRPSPTHIPLEDGALPFLLPTPNPPLAPLATPACHAATPTTSTCSGTSTVDRCTPARLCLHSAPKSGRDSMATLRHRQLQLRSVSVVSEALTA